MTPATRLRVLPGLAGLLLLLAGCLASPPRGEESVSRGCAATLGRYVDAGRRANGRTIPMAEVLGLDPDTTGPVPDAERAVDIVRREPAGYLLAIAKVTPPDTVPLWEVAARCEDGELRFETLSRYESTDGVRVTRQQLRFALLADEDGALVVRRELRERSLGLLDLRRGGDPVEFYRFERQ